MKSIFNHEHVSTSTTVNDRVINGCFLRKTTNKRTHLSQSFSSPIKFHFLCCNKITHLSQSFECHIPVRVSCHDRFVGDVSPAFYSRTSFQLNLAAAPVKDEEGRSRSTLTSASIVR
ncbi:hypothetical protein YC2023_035470 [Brassica napus]